MLPAIPRPRQIQVLQHPLSMGLNATAALASIQPIGGLLAGKCA